MIDLLKTKLITGKWAIAFFCKNCRMEISTKQKMKSYGVCPYCGKRSGNSVIETFEMSKRRVGFRYEYQEFEQVKYQAVYSTKFQNRILEGKEESNY